MARFTWTPDFGAKRKTKPRVGAVQFGDGYSQRVPDGINTQLPTWDLTFKDRDESEIEDIVAFLEARDGVEAFEWTPPRGTGGLWICSEWTDGLDKPLRGSLTATFTKVPA